MYICFQTKLQFIYKFDKKIFKAIYTLYANGAKIVRPIDIEGIFSQDPGNKVLFEQSNGIEYLQDLQELAEVNNFHFYYNLLKKINLLNDLKKNGFDISSFYIEDLIYDLLHVFAQQFLITLVQARCGSHLENHTS